MDEVKVVTIVAFLSCVILLAYLKGAFNPAPPPAPSSVATTEKRASYCGKVSASCLALAEFRSESCDQAQAAKTITQLLTNPLTTKSCENAIDELRKKCLPACQLNFKQLIVIPGAIEIKPPELQADSSACIIRGSRSVNLSASCSKAPASSSSGD